MSRLFSFISQGMSLLEKINARLRQESGVANSNPLNTDAANSALMDYLSGKGSAQAAAEAFNKVANEAIASGKLTAAEVSALEGYVNTTQVYVDVLGLLGDNVGVGVGAGTSSMSGRFPRTAAEYEDLAKDPARGGNIDDKGIAERDVALGLEAQGKVGKLARDPSGRADFIDTETGQKWDVKGFYSKFAPRGYTLKVAMSKIIESITKGEYVMLDARNLYPEHLAELLGEIVQQGLTDKVLIWP